MACNNVDGIALLAVIWGSAEIVLFAGIIFGWHNIVYVYKDLGYFSYLCPVPENNTENAGILSYRDSSTWNYSHASSVNSSELSCIQRLELASLESRSDCKEQDEQFNIIFSLATFLTGVMCIANGWFYDRFGTRKCRIIAMICCISGMLFLIFVSPESAYLLYPGYILLSYGGYIILITNLQLSALMPRFRSMLIAGYCGSYDVSSTIFLFFKLAYENHGITPNTCFIVMTTLFVLVLSVSSFGLLPKYKIPWPRPSKYRYHPQLCKLIGKTPPSTDGNEGRIIYSEEPKIEVQSNVFISPKLSLSEGNNTNVNNEPLNDIDPSGLLTSDLISQSGERKVVNSEIDSSDQSNCKGPNGAFSESHQSKTTSKHDDDIANQSKIIKTADHSEPGDELNHLMNGASDNTRIHKLNRTASFKDCVKSPLYLCDLMWMSIHRLRSWMFIGVFNPWMTRLACGDKALVSHYTSFLSSTQFIGIFTASLSGCVMDRKIHKNYHNIHKFERIHASIASFVLNCTVGLLLSIGMTLPILSIQYLTCLLSTIHRSFLYGPNNAFLANAFPMEHFGKLMGISFTVSAVFGLLQYPLFLLIQGPLHKDPLVVNILICVLVLCTYIHPMYIWFYLRKKFKGLN